MSRSSPTDGRDVYWQGNAKVSQSVSQRAERQAHHA
jgi:hypothetical protein